MTRPDAIWHSPSSRAEAIRLRADAGEEGVIVAGGTFLGVLMNNGVLQPEVMISLRHVRDMKFVEIGEELRLGAMITHRQIELGSEIARCCPMLSRTFSLVANPRIRNWATVGGVLADADYASDPPAALIALGARVVLESPAGRREVTVEALIEDLYQTVIAENEILTEVVVPLRQEAAVYRKFRTRSHEDRPCVSVAAARRHGVLRVAVGAVAGKPQIYPDICALADGRRIDRAVAVEIGQAYADRIEPMTDARGSADYRKRVIAVEVRRALEDLAA